MLKRLAIALFLIGLAACDATPKPARKVILADEQLAQVREAVMRPRLTDAEAKVVLETPPENVGAYRMAGEAYEQLIYVWRMPDGSRVSVVGYAHYGAIDAEEVIFEN